MTNKKSAPLFEKFKLSDLRHEIRKLLMLAGPIFIGQLSASILGVTDSLMSGAISTVDLAAISLGALLYLPVSLFCFGIPFGMGPIAAHLYGAGKFAEIPRTVFNAIYPSAAVIAPCIIGLFILPDLLLDSVEEPELARKTVSYLRWMTLALPAQQIFFICKNALEGLSVAVPSMVIGILICVLNIPANLVFMYGHLGFPALGSPGCGISSALVSWIAALLIILYAVKSSRLRKSGIRIAGRFYRPVAEDIRHICLVGLPISVAAVLESSIFTVSGYLLTRFGSATVAASQIASTVYTMAFMIPISMSIAVSIRTGQHLGAGSLFRTKLCALSGFIVSSIMVIPFMFIIYMNRYDIIGWFTDDPEVIAIAAPLFLFVLGYQTQDPFFGTAMGILRGFKDTRIFMVLNIVILWGLAVPLAWTVGLTDITGSVRGVNGIWAVIVSCYYLMTAAFIWRDVWLFRHPGRYLGTGFPNSSEKE
ncbi:MATE family efflux transporter [Succinimonas amylolytica]|uniref:MATE family efflux transporter n=1 Tax=Succinimonas amylolytica TaxID=83769 RepID=UPI000378E4C6|nr:MATE family efflux transporter [Succinimonas amylolytica]